MNEEKARKGNGRNIVHSTFVSDVSIYKKTPEKNQAFSEVQSNAPGIIDPDEEFRTPTDKKLKDFLNSVNIQEHLQFQLVGERSILRMVESEKKERILEDLKVAKVMEEKFKGMEEKSKAARIKSATGWEKTSDGRWKYETDDSMSQIKFAPMIQQAIQTAPDLLVELSDKASFVLSDILDTPETFNIFPFMKNVSISFYTDENAFRGLLTPDGIKINTKYLQGIDGEKGLKGTLVHEMQHIIQAVEFAESNGRFVVTGFDFDDTKQEAADAIKSVNALYGYTPEFLEIYAQVGAAYASLSKSITQPYREVKQKSQDEKTIKELEPNEFAEKKSPLRNRKLHSEQKNRLQNKKRQTL